ncbi:hypothetical protein VE00_06813 [Pseudogymnoascus sp. WSF 3629]|nr:hypothetical protein VE00_06813 [Pseudogymnoascus sp. WSF 3629]
MAETLDRTGRQAGKPIELAIPLPNAPQTKIYIRLTISATSILLLLTTVFGGESAIKPALGSFVYALPDRVNPGQTLCTQLYTYESSIDFTTRLAKLLARKSKIPVYVGNSMEFSSAGMGGTVEEEMAGFKAVVEVVMAEVNHLSQPIDAGIKHAS